MRTLAGRPIADALLDQLATTVGSLARPPLLVIVSVGDHAPSQRYIRHKRRAAERIGVTTRQVALPGDVTLAMTLDVIQDLNQDPDVTGILLQLPVPEHLSERVLCNAIATAKDVDGLADASLGALTAGTHGTIPATARAVMALLDAYDIPIAGQRAVVIGRSRLVGLPTALLLIQRHATVSVTHRQTTDIYSYTQTADIIISAAGQPAFLTADHIRPGATVIDVGISEVAGKLVGDAHPSVESVAGALSPVPGGIGPLTVASLLQNVVSAATAEETR